MNSEDITVTAVAFAVVELLGVVTAGHAVMYARTSQGAIAWSICLVIFPYLTLPLYWVFGRNRFQGYIKARQSGKLEIHRLVARVRQYVREQGFVSEKPHPEHYVLEALVKMKFSRSNRVELLIDGQATFGTIFDAIEKARDYILVQFFIVHDDTLGRELKQRLEKKSKAGVRVFFLYDEIGSRGLPRSYVNELKQADIDVRPFHSTRGRRNRFQLNFRNHRKIVVVDGQEAYVGGLNVGDEYMGRSAKIGAWRDTHVKLTGPCVHSVQLVFVEDWYWTTRELPELDWTPRPTEGSHQNVLILPSGPADRLETCGMFFVHAINSAKRRLWIASPYFVPDIHVMCALQMAALRGVDVRIMLPQKPDHVLVYLSGFSFLKEAEQAGVSIHRYQPGFLHQKVLLVDDEFAAVGTANLDNRSFRLNFEITAVVNDREFATQVAAMLECDFSNCKVMTSSDLQERPFWFKLAVSTARLLAPIQ